jgi:uncharacterized protein YbaP (TraB family)
MRSVAPSIGGRLARAWRMLGLAVLLAGASPAPAEPTFESLADAKALAVVPTRPEIGRGLAHSQPHDLAASVRAREQCQVTAAAGELCEVVRLNDQRITTGAEIRARVPKEPHPLFLWRYRGDRNVVYLAGSIHILKPSLYPLPQQLDDAFQRSDYLVLEVNVASFDLEEMQRRTMAHARLPDQQTLADVLPAPLHQRLDRHLGAFGMTAAMLSRAKPAMVMNHVVVSRLLTLGYLPDSGLESHFLSRRSGQEILELESLDAQLELLFDQPLATQIQLLAETLDMEAGIEPLLAGLLVAWLSGNDAEFLELFKAQSGDSPLSRDFTRKLLDERNHTMAERIRGYLTDDSAEPASYFVLVGAAHLVGDQGIVQLLARHGIHGERVLSNERIGTTEETP